MGLVLPGVGSRKSPDAGRHRGRAAGLPDGPGPGRLHDQPDHLGAGGVPLSRRPGHGDGLEHRSRPAQLLHHRAGGRPPSRSWAPQTFPCRACTTRRQERWTSTASRSWTHLWTTRGHDGLGPGGILPAGGLRHETSCAPTP